MMTNLKQPKSKYEHNTELLVIFTSPLTLIVAKKMPTCCRLSDISNKQYTKKKKTDLDEDQF